MAPPRELDIALTNQGTICRSGLFDSWLYRLGLRFFEGFLWVWDLRVAWVWHIFLDDSRKKLWYFRESPRKG